MIRLVVWLVEAFTAVYVLVAFGSLVVGFARFLIELPGAIRKDMERWRKEHAEPPRELRYVRNEAEDRASKRPALSPPMDRDPRGTRRPGAPPLPPSIRGHEGA